MNLLLRVGQVADLLRDATGLELDHKCSEIRSLSVKIDILQRDLPLEKELKPEVTVDLMLLAALAAAVGLHLPWLDYTSC